VLPPLPLLLPPPVACRAKPEDFRRVWVFTNDDNPVKDDAVERRASIQRAKVPVDPPRSLDKAHTPPSSSPR
jgi:hypothetical protein